MAWGSGPFKRIIGTHPDNGIGSICNKLTDFAAKRQPVCSTALNRFIVRVYRILFVIAAINCNQSKSPDRSGRRQLEVRTRRSPISVGFIRYITACWPPAFPPAKIASRLRRINWVSQSFQCTDNQSLPFHRQIDIVSKCNPTEPFWRSKNGSAL